MLYSLSSFSGANSSPSPARVEFLSNRVDRLASTLIRIQGSGERRLLRITEDYTMILEGIKTISHTVYNGSLCNDMFTEWHTIVSSQSKHNIQQEVKVHKVGD